VIFPDAENAAYDFLTSDPTSWNSSKHLTSDGEINPTFFDAFFPFWDLSSRVTACECQQQISWKDSSTLTIFSSNGGVVHSHHYKMDQHELGGTTGEQLYRPPTFDFDFCGSSVVDTLVE
jgi:hypothetical protein